MAIKAHIHKVEVLKAVERNGTVQRLTTGAVVTGLGGNTDWNSLAEAMDAQNVPRYGDHLGDEDSPVYSLVVHEREVTMNDDKDSASVVITYENSIGIDNLEDRFDAPFMGLMMGEVRCNIQQKTSNLDNDGNQVVLSHEYPMDDPNFGGTTRYQGGEFNYFAAQRSFSIHGIKATNAPWAVANSIVGCVNIFPFSGEAARTWMCVAANWKPESNRDGIARYLMRFEFQFDADTWDPTVVYIDDSTGKPPVGLVPGFGIKTIQKHRAVHFEYIIGTYIHGA